MKQTTPLTKEYFDEKLSSFAANFATKEHLDARIDELAIATAKGFGEVHEKLKDIKLDLYETEARLNDRIVAVEEHFGKIEQHIGRIDVRFSNMYDIIVQDHGPRIINLEKELGV